MESLDDLSGRDLAQEWDEKDVSYLFMLVAETEGEYSRISSTDLDLRRSQISIRQFVETHRNSGWKMKHHYKVTDFSASVQPVETFQVLASYPHKSVHQPWGRIRGNRRSEAFRPLRCTVADTDDFLQIKRKLVRVNERYSTYQVKQMKSHGLGRGGETWTLFTVLLSSSTFPLWSLTWSCYAFLFFLKLVVHSVLGPAPLAPSPPTHMVSWKPNRKTECDNVHTV